MKLIISTDEALEAIAFWLEQKKGLTVSLDDIGAIIAPGGYDGDDGDDEWDGFSVEIGEARFVAKDDTDESSRSTSRIP